jgi:flagella basal body P-ring formation protein FlgA
MNTTANICEMEISPIILKVGDSFYQSYYSQIFKKSNCSPEIVNYVEDKVLSSSGKIPTRHLLGEYASKVGINQSMIEVVDLRSHMKSMALNNKSDQKKMKLIGGNNIIGINSHKSIQWSWGANENQVFVSIVDKNNIDHKIEFAVENVRSQTAYRAGRDIAALAEQLTASDFSKEENEELSDGPHAPFTQIDKISFYRTTRSIKKGELLYEKDFSPINLIETGKMIKVLGESKGIQVKAEGRALGSGSIGQTITIENQKSKRKYSAEVIDYNTVKLHL